MSGKDSKGLQHTVEGRLGLLTFIANAVPSALLIFTLWWFEVSLYVLGIAAVFLLFLALYSVITVRQSAQYQFRTLHNLLESLVQGNYAFRGAAPGKHGAFKDLLGTINALATTLQQQKLQSAESQLLLKKVVDRIDVAIIAWDQHACIVLINPAAKTLLGISEERLSAADNKGLPAELVFAAKMKPGDTQVRSLVFANARGKFRLHMEQFIAQGNQHKLLFMTDVSNLLRSEEKKAWQNLIRVLSHEINNSLVPLSSLSNTLRKQVEKRERDAELAEELIDGMSIISNRAESLADFVQYYHKISKLPVPQKTSVELRPLLERLKNLFPQEDIRIRGAPVHLLADAAQMEQALINLIKNAIEANEDFALQNNQAKAPIAIRWTRENAKLVMQIIDGGAGVRNPDNLFTPFYTTKAKGSGVGLVLSQQIIEAHDGYLSLANREDRQGCMVTIELPCPEGLFGVVHPLSASGQ